MTTVEHAAPTLRHGYTQCRYGELHYLEALPAVASAQRATPLVLLHQNPSSSEEYRPLARHMGMDRRVIAFDTPGSGMSDWPPAPASMQALAAAFDDGLRALGFDAAHPVDVFGYHTGTLLAAELALAQPSLVRRMVLSGIPYRTQAECAERLATARATAPLSEDGAAVMQRLEALWRYVVTERRRCVPLARAAELFMEKAKALHRSWWPYEGVWTYDVPDRFGRVVQPVLVLQPSEGLLEQSKRATRFLARGRIVELPSLSRDVFEADIDTFCAPLRLFLAEES